MSKLFNISIVFLAMSLLGASIQSTAQTKKSKKKTRKIVHATFAVEYPATPDDPFYKMTVELPPVDRVELFYVTHLRKDQPLDAQSKTMVIWGQQYQIISEKILLEEAAQDFAAQWRKILRGPGAGCFAPAYRLRFWARGQMLLETDVCYHCRNLTIPQDGRAEIRAFNAEGKSGKELLRRLQEFLPESIPRENHR